MKAVAKQFRSISVRWSACLSTARQEIDFSIRAFRLPDRFGDRVLNLIVSLRQRPNTDRFLNDMGRLPNYASPVNWSDKIQWRKVFDRNPLFQVFCDKIRARDFVSAKDSRALLAKTYWIGKDPDQLPFDTISRPYVVKPNHRSGDKWFVRQPKAANRQEIVEACRLWLKQPHGASLSEWGYKDIDGRILVEEYLGDDVDTYPENESGTPGIVEYKFFVIAGKILFGQAEAFIDSKIHRTIIDRSGSPMGIRKWHSPRSPDLPDIPNWSVAHAETYETMISIAERLGKDIDFVRVDFYQAGGEIYFGELTPYPDSGMSCLYDRDAEFDSFPPSDLDKWFGDQWVLPKIPFWLRFYRACFD